MTTRQKAIAVGFTVGLAATIWLIFLDWQIAICVIALGWADRFCRSLV